MTGKGGKEADGPASVPFAISRCFDCAALEFLLLQKIDAFKRSTLDRRVPRVPATRIIQKDEAVFQLSVYFLSSSVCYSFERMGEKSKYEK